MLLRRRTTSVADAVGGTELGSRGAHPRLTPVYLVSEPSGISSDALLCGWHPGPSRGRAFGGALACPTSVPFSAVTVS